MLAHNFPISFFSFSLTTLVEKSNHNSNARGGPRTRELHHDRMAGEPGPVVAHITPLINLQWSERLHICSWCWFEIMVRNTRQVAPLRSPVCSIGLKCDFYYKYGRRSGGNFRKCNFSVSFSFARMESWKVVKDGRSNERGKGGKTNNILAMLIGLYCHSDSIAAWDFTPTEKRIMSSLSTSSNA